LCKLCLTKQVITIDLISTYWQSATVTKPPSHTSSSSSNRQSYIATESFSTRRDLNVISNKLFISSANCSTLQSSSSSRGWTQEVDYLGKWMGFRLILWKVRAPRYSVDVNCTVKEQKVTARNTYLYSAISSSEAPKYVPRKRTDITGNNYHIRM